jgi:hypothetical protein
LLRWPPKEEDRVLGIGKSKLLTTGALTDGVVIDVKRQLLAGGNFGDTYHVTVRVKFDDASTAETKQKLSGLKAGKHFDAAIVPVRYDAGDRSKIAVDVPALEADQRLKLAESEAARTARIERAETEAASPPR